MSIVNILFVGLGGAVGSILRYLVTQIFAYQSWTAVWATFVVNIVGSFIIGIALSMSEGRASLMLGVGFCGGFTTFSTFSSQTLQLFSSGQYFMAIGYALASVMCCVLATFAGVATARLFVAR